MWARSWAGFGVGGCGISRMADRTVSGKMTWVVKSIALSQVVWVHIPALLLANCVTLGKLLDLTKPQSSHL